MSQDFASAAFVRSIRNAPALKPIHLCEPLQGSPMSLTYLADWGPLGVDFGLGQNQSTIPNVALRLSTGSGAGGSINIPRGVYIDNTEVASPVYLVCQDTGHIVVCPDYACVTAPLLTGGTEFKLVIGNIRPAYSAKQQTRVILTNVALPPSNTNEFNQVQPLNRVSGLAAFTVPVIGDKLASAQLTRADFPAFPDAAGNYASVPIVLSPAKSNSYRVLTNFQCQQSDFQPGTSFGTPGSYSLTNGATVIAAGPLTSYQQRPPPYLVFSFNGLQVTLDGAQPLTFNANVFDPQRGWDQTAGAISLQLICGYAIIDVPAI